jgi:hypothetical protein
MKRARTLFWRALNREEADYEANHTIKSSVIAAKDRRLNDDMSPTNIVYYSRMITRNRDSNNLAPLHAALETTLDIRPKILGTLLDLELPTVGKQKTLTKRVDKTLER